MSELDKSEKPDEYLRSMPKGRYLKSYLNWVRSFPGGMPEFFSKYNGDISYGFYLGDRCEFSSCNSPKTTWKCNDEKGIFYVSTYMNNDD